MARKGQVNIPKVKTTLKPKGLVGRTQKHVAAIKSIGKPVKKPKPPSLPAGPGRRMK